MKYELKIKGMMCMHCQKHASDALNGMEKVKHAEVDLENETATVEALEPIAEQEFKDVIAEEGYEVVSFKEL